MAAEGVRARLREIREESRHGKPVTKELKTEMRELSTQATAQAGIVNINRQARAASHQSLVSVGCIVSTVSSVACSALAITTPWSVAMLAFGKTNSQLVEVRAENERTSAQLKAEREAEWQKTEVDED